MSGGVAEPVNPALAPFTFPTTWKASWSHWWSANSTSGYSAQSALIKRGLEGSSIPLIDYNDPVNTQSVQEGQKVAKLRRVDLGGGKDRVLNLLEVGTPVRKPGEHTFLVLHGYGGAFAFWWQNMLSLCSLPNTRVYFADMLGMGLSGRPSFPSIKVKGDTNTPANARSRAEQAESFFLDSFEDFAKKENLSSFTMVGHSLGGYLSTAYALKYPHRVNKLVLVSPVGIPKSPYHNDAEEEAKMGADARVQLDNVAAEDAAQSRPASPSSTSSAPRPRPPNAWWTRLWEANVSPFSIVRMSSFAAPKLVSRYASRRFALFEPEVQSDLFNYLYSVYGQRGSGEYCLAHILSPGAYARWPLISRMAQLDSKIAVSFIYGDSDWMDKKGGEAAAQMLRARANMDETARKRTQTYVNPHAGHWVMLDNPGGMNKIFDSILKETIADLPSQ